MVVSLVSFGFKHGIPYGTDLLFDVRFLRNPHFVPGLRAHTGRTPRGAGVPRAAAGLRRGGGPARPTCCSSCCRATASENRSYLSVAVGCTGGRHRSVAVCERLAHALDDGGLAGARRSTATSDARVRR